MASSTMVRDWAEAQGRPVSRKGRVPAELITDWDTSHPDDPYEAPERAAATGPDYPDADFESAFAEIPPGDPGDTGETPPKRPRSRSKLGGGIGGWFRKGPKGRKRPRVSTEDFLGAVWRAAAGIAKPLPPLYRTLRVQAPVAGVILDDAVTGTIIDPLLQPFARMANAGKAGAALAGPPVLVTAISIHVQTMAAKGEPPNRIFMEMSREALRSSLMAWLDIAGPKFEAAMQREREFESRYGSSVDEMMEWLFSAPADAETEEANIRRAQGIRDDDHPGM